MFDLVFLLRAECGELFDYLTRVVRCSEKKTRWASDVELLLGWLSCLYQLRAAAWSYGIVRPCWQRQCMTLKGLIEGGDMQTWDTDESLLSC